jgi:hypothetical protein
MESDKVKDARKNEVGYCGDYCRTCHWYTDGMRKPAAQLLELVKNHFEVAMWINVKGGSSEETIKGSKYFQKVHVTSIARVVVVGTAVQFANAVWRRALISVLNVQSFHAKEIGVKKANTPIFLRLIR